MKKVVFTLFVIMIIISPQINAQKNSINWITFEQLEDSLKIKPKKVFISFYADWCSYCKKMDNTGFKNEKVIKVLNDNFYSIKMNAETEDEILFDGKTYKNEQLGKFRKPTHQIPILLASRKNKPFSLPATIVLDKKFKIKERYFEYLSPKKLIEILN
jgi:thioredoxin-related protein